jgi:hypothetical protein
MTHSRPVSHVRTALLAVTGPALVGAALGMPFGLSRLLSQAAAVPAIVVGLSVLMIPALYIATTLIGVAPAAERVAAASVSALGAAGTVLLGLAPATLFLIATSRTTLVVWVLGFLVLSAGMLASLRILFSDLFSTSGARLRALPVFLIWTVVTLGLGAHLVVRSLRHTTQGGVAQGAQFGLTNVGT